MDMTKVLEEHTREAILVALYKLIENECERLATDPSGVALLSLEI